MVWPSTASRSQENTPDGDSTPGSDPAWPADRAGHRDLREHTEPRGRGADLRHAVGTGEDALARLLDPDALLRGRHEAARGRGLDMLPLLRARPRQLPLRERQGRTRDPLRIAHGSALGGRDRVAD